MRDGFSQRERHGLRLGATVEKTIWDPHRVTHMEPSLNPVLKDATEYRPGARRSARRLPKGNRRTQQGLPVGTLWSKRVHVAQQADTKPGPLRASDLSGTKGTTGVPAVGQRGGTQGRGSGGSLCEAARSGITVCWATLTWFHGWTEGAVKSLATRCLTEEGDESGEALTLTSRKNGFSALKGAPYRP
ncbi:hypothetical protein DPX16_11648 [Anabarilius grahami]|uniref:Uncharacterized protein n=1 Tax=Anabarilius grahami TaxID=495550 RepID=A0A3N0Z2R2_ANAGA|nr:hypothetical protein DPX16_11648 [Anabarilius grahami]